LLSFPTTRSALTESSLLSVETRSWSPWFYPVWQPGLGEPFVLGASLDAVVEQDDLCAPNLRTVWDARASCRRFQVSIDAEGWLDISLRWDAAAEGFDPGLAGDVVLVAPNGNMAASGWQHLEESVSARVQPGNYGILVMSYVRATLPFQISAVLRPQ
jgi:hypothetical protein